MLLEREGGYCWQYLVTLKQQHNFHHITVIELLNFSELNKRNSPFCAAPGAERSNSASSSNNLGDSPSSSNW